MSIRIVKLGAWEEIHTYLKPGWIYRGQKSEGWPLKTSLERCCERENIAPNKRVDIESELRRDFRRAYHHYAQHLPQTDSILEWISLMQHHGAPTRLLDFSYSIYVAAYFALERADSDCAVWAVRAPWALRESVAAFQKKGKTYAAGLQKKTIEAHESIAGRLLFDGPMTKAAIPLTPFRLSERLRTQRATFLVPGDINRSFHENLISLPSHGLKRNLVKIVIPLNLRSIAIESLFSMNISRTSLFPGLDGYSESLGVFHPAFRPDPFDQIA